MGVKPRRFVNQAQGNGDGWRIFDTTIKRFWGPPFKECPEQLTNELNTAAGRLPSSRAEELIAQYRKRK